MGHTVDLDLQLGGIALGRQQQLLVIAPGLGHCGQLQDGLSQDLVRRAAAELAPDRIGVKAAAVQIVAEHEVRGVLHQGAEHLLPAARFGRRVPVGRSVAGFPTHSTIPFWTA